MAVVMAWPSVGCRHATESPADWTRRRTRGPTRTIPRYDAPDVVRAGGAAVRAVPGGCLRPPRPGWFRGSAWALLDRGPGGDVVELLDELGVEQASYVGISLGGAVGLWLAENAGDR